MHDKDKILIYAILSNLGGFTIEGIPSHCFNRLDDQRKNH